MANLLCMAIFTPIMRPQPAQSLLALWPKTRSVAALGYLNPIIAAAAMALGSLSVIANSALLKRVKL
ncbi:MAG TPA: hypothetical protein VFW37_14140 [Alphaproteobacteria bacterium]|nr:hypothetical protein [Alphaproteobacteria bacterium]